MTENQHGINKHFNSHAHVERDEGVTFVYNEKSNFNSHAHVERDNHIFRITQKK